MSLERKIRCARYSSSISNYLGPLFKSEGEQETGETRPDLTGAACSTSSEYENGSSEKCFAAGHQDTPFACPYDVELL